MIALTPGWQARLLMVLEFGLMVYVLVRALIAFNGWSNRQSRPRRVVTQDQHRYALYLSLRAFFPRLTAHHIEAIVNRRMQERQGAKR